ncbi:low-temperature-induced 65 kDa protein isoform X1 [Ricinus communis]|uniref:low-temperature-induced 65 kDa protein isoform X1 n=1 Tax=Ricinus communis TaxID=3988 RepID=UPI000772ADD7|nr:low-temperature-induced 65 kDa protein isoform X1 [Ricinus communis]|eukprot:XP_002510792.2 low-temperature-induced 65 kDa protein isoform X1 [Ricinus communis]
MNSQILRPHGHPYEQETHNAGLHAEDEDHEKKSVLKKVKAKAKKIKNTLVHGHGHNHDHEEDRLHRVPDDHDLYEEDDDEDDEMFDDPQIHGTSAAFESAATKNSSVSGQAERLDDPEAYYGRSTAMKDDYYGDHARVTGREKSFLPGEEVALRRTSNIKEVPHTPLNAPASITPGIVEQTKVANPIETSTREQKANSRGQPEVNLEMPKGLEEDPHAPKDRPEDTTPSNYQTKVADPTGAGGGEIGITSILPSFDKMNITSEPKPRAEEDLPTRPHDKSIFPTGSHDQFSPEPISPMPVDSHDSSRSVSETPDASKQGSYKEKIYSATSAIADKAISAKNVIASKIGYQENNNKEHEMHVGEEQRKTNLASSPVEYGKKVAATVTEKLSPVYEKVAETSNIVMSKVPGIGGSIGSEGANNVKGQDKGVSVKDYFAEKLRPGDEDRALSEVISEALHKQKQEMDQPIGKVTESEEVKRRLGSNEENLEENVDQSSVRIPGGGMMIDKIKGAVGSMLGKRVETQGSSAGNVSASGEETGEKRLQESAN